MNILRISILAALATMTAWAQTPAVMTQARAGLQVNTTHGSFEIASVVFQFPGDPAQNEFTFAGDGHNHGGRTTGLFPDLTVIATNISNYTIKKNRLTIDTIGTYNGEPARIMVTAVDNGRNGAGDTLAIHVNSTNGTHLFHCSATVTLGDIEVVGR